MSLFIAILTYALIFSVLILMKPQKRRIYVSFNTCIRILWMIFLNSIFAINTVQTKYFAVALDCLRTMYTKVFLYYIYFICMSQGKNRILFRSLRCLRQSETTISISSLGHGPAIHRVKALNKGWDISSQFYWWTTRRYYKNNLQWKNKFSWPLFPIVTKLRFIILVSVAVVFEFPGLQTLKNTFSFSFLSMTIPFCYL